MSFAMNESRFTPIEKPKSTQAPTLPVFELQKPAIVSKRPRNLKNLAVNTTASYNLGRAIATAPLKTQENQDRVSAPASPAFVKPPAPPKRKLGKISLTIMTPANSNVTNMAVPPTPSVTRPITLRHFQSSPSLPLYTAGAGPAGGMTLPKTRTLPQPRGFAEIPLEDEEEEEQNFDVPQSREDKPESYPNGPIRIYESGIDLYQEPPLEVAMRYDVIINCASEVNNPFEVADREARLQPPLQQPTSNVGILADGSSNNAGSPTTPKATPLSTDTPIGAFSQAQKRPEYIHMQWEHNTDIVDDLRYLVRLIDDRVKQGKKVLVHCQLGVSRSASLIVAYGIFTNPHLSVQDAYDAVKKRSKWIGPNMSLIMQLQEFRSSMHKGSMRDHGFQSQVFTLPRKSSTIPSASTTDSFGVKTPSEPPTPRTVPFPTDESMTPEPLPSSHIGPFSAGPVEPGSGSFWDEAFRRSWGSGQANNDMGMPGMPMAKDTNYVDAKGHVVPVTVLQGDQSSSTSPSGSESQAEQFRERIFTRPLPFREEYKDEVDTLMTDAPPAEPLLSPRATEFHMAPLMPPQQVASNDRYNILSPTMTEFPKQSVFSSTASTAPPPPTRAAPPPPAVRELKMESLNSIFSPTTNAFPALPAVSPFGGPASLCAPHPRQAERIDSLVPSSPPLQLSPPKPNRRLRTKFSAPNLSECIKLQKMQSDLANKLPQRPAEAEEALMSPRATEFVANPFHLSGPIKEEGAEQAAVQGGAPGDSAPAQGTSTADPRSPATFGISPITRNIFGVL